MALKKHIKVFTIFSFLRIKSPDIAWYQWGYPTLIFLLIYMGWKLALSKFLKIDDVRIIDDINVLMGILVGFYIAALAAVSSFTNDNLDQVMKGRAPTLVSRRQGNNIKENLTRRRFLSILFGYCALVAIVLYVAGVIGRHISLSIAVPVNWLWVVSVTREIGTMFYLWLMSSLLVVTLLGLHYLVERMHRA